MLVKQCQVDSNPKLGAGSPVLTDPLERIKAYVFGLTKARQHKFHEFPFSSQLGNKSHQLEVTSPRL